LEKDQVSKEQNEQ